MQRSDSPSPPIQRVVVRAPATIANLGPGFDCLGASLAWYNEVRVERDPAGELTVTATGRGADVIPRDETNLVVRALRARVGPGGGLRVHLTNAIPLGRGFGSSASAIVAGLVAGRALQGRAGPPGELLPAATELEGHADNVAPCLTGGAVIVTGGSVMELGVAGTLEFVVCVAPNALPTEAARRALPERVPFADAAATAGRAALLAASLATGRSEALYAATDDVLHQPARFAMMPDSGRLVAALRGERIPAFLAGAGPSVAALLPSAESGAGEEVAGRLVPDGWEVRRVAIDATGAAVVESDPPLA